MRRTPARSCGAATGQMVGGRDPAVTRAVLKNSNFFLLRTAPKYQPPTANRQPPTANRRQPPTAVQYCFCGFVSCPCLDHETESVPVNVPVCWRYEPCCPPPPPLQPWRVHKRRSSRLAGGADVTVTGSATRQRDCAQGRAAVISRPASGYPPMIQSFEQLEISQIKELVNKHLLVSADALQLRSFQRAVERLVAENNHAVVQRCVWRRGARGCRPRAAPSSAAGLFLRGRDVSAQLRRAYPRTGAAVPYRRGRA